MKFLATIPANHVWEICDGKHHFCKVPLVTCIFLTPSYLLLFTGSSAKKKSHPSWFVTIECSYDLRFVSDILSVIVLRLFNKFSSTLFGSPSFPRASRAHMPSSTEPSAQTPQFSVPISQDQERFEKFQEGPSRSEEQS